MDTKAWKFFTSVSVIRQLGLIGKTTAVAASQEGVHKDVSEDGGENVDGNALVREVQKNKRNDVLKSIDAILARVGVPIFHNHDRIINAGGVEVLLHVLDTFKSDAEIVELIFQIFVCLMEGDEKYSSSINGCIVGGNVSSSNLNSNSSVNSVASCVNIGNNDKAYRTGRRIHLNGSEELISFLCDIYKENDEIRVLGNFISKSMVKAETYAAIETVSQVKQAVQFMVPFETYAAIDTKVSVPKSIQNTAKAGQTPGICCARKVKEVPGQLGIDIVLSNMLKFVTNGRIQLEGFDIILSCIKQNDDRSLNMLINEKCATVLIQAIGMNIYSVRWRAHFAMMKLSSRSRMCECIEKRGGCKALMGVLKELPKEDDESSIYQIALWSLSNLCKVEYSLQTLVELGLKPLLHNLLQSDPRMVSPPLFLRTLYPKSDLEEASRFELRTNVEGPSIKPHGGILPPPKDAGPSHGTTGALFDAGCPGLV